MKITLKMLPRATAGMVIDALHSYFDPIVWLWRWMKRSLGTRLGLHVHRWGPLVRYRESNGFKRECTGCGSVEKIWLLAPLGRVRIGIFDIMGSDDDKMDETMYRDSIWTSRAPVE